MPNTREKLIELLSQVQYLGGLEEKVADYLIDNGVTVQEWIPVTERLPEKYETVLTYDGYSVEPGVFYGNSYFYELDKGVSTLWYNPLDAFA